MRFRSFVSGSPTTKELFTGKERDEETSLDYFGARYYDASIGRWLSVDPLVEKHPDFSPYNYVLNSPLILIDPDGKQTRYDIITRQRQESVIKGETSKEAYIAQAYADFQAVMIGLGFLSIGRVAEGFVGVAEDIATGNFGLGSVLNFLPGGDEIGDTRKVLKGAQNPKVKEAIKKGKKAHADFKQKVDNKPGWKSEPRMTDPQTGKTVIPDATTPGGNPVELKPNTPSGKTKGAKQLQGQERATGKKGRVVKYDPEKIEN